MEIEPSTSWAPCWGVDLVQAITLQTKLLWLGNAFELTCKKTSTGVVQSRTYLMSKLIYEAFGSIKHLEYCLPSRWWSGAYLLSQLSDICLRRLKYQQCQRRCDSQGYKILVNELGSIIFLLQVKQNELSWSNWSLRVWLLILGHVDSQVDSRDAFGLELESFVNQLSTHVNYH